VTLAERLDVAVHLPAPGVARVVVVVVVAAAGPTLCHFDSLSLRRSVRHFDALPL